MSRRVTGHRRTASFRALRAIRCISPIRAADRTEERRRLERDRRNRARSAVLRDVRDYFGLPQPQRPCRAPVPRQEDPIIVLSSDTSADNLPPPRQPDVVQLDFDSSIDELPNIDPRPQHQLPVRERLVQPAYVLLERLQLPVEQLPQLQQPQRPQMPPPEVEPEIDWGELEEGLAAFDAPLPQQLGPLPLLPQPPLQVDWALIAYSLAMLREMELQHQHRQQL